jgi:hypothetical protein
MVSWPRVLLVIGGLVFFMSNTADADERRQIGLAMVALAEERIPSGDEILRYVNTKWPMTRHFNKVEVRDDVIFFDGDDGEIVFVSLMPAPIPPGDIEYPCKTAFHWPEACAEFGKSVAHAIISVMPRSNEDPVDILIQTTMLTQAVSQLAGGLGIYWGSGELVERPRYLCRAGTQHEPRSTARIALGWREI